MLCLPILSQHQNTNCSRNIYLFWVTFFFNSIGLRVFKTRWANVFLNFSVVPSWLSHGRRRWIKMYLFYYIFVTSLEIIFRNCNFKEFYDILDFCVLFTTDKLESNLIFVEEGYLFGSLFLSNGCQRCRIMYLKKRRRTDAMWNKSICKFMMLIF